MRENIASSMNVSLFSTISLLELGVSIIHPNVVKAPESCVNFTRKYPLLVRLWVCPMGAAQEKLEKTTKQAK